MTAQDFKAWRTRIGWTQQKAADELGVCRKSIILYECRGQRIPVKIELACQALEARQRG
jgi:DNA-binding XRE family transcriptional regulator